MDIRLHWKKCVQIEGDNWRKIVITANETSIYYYDPELNNRSTQWVEWEVAHLQIFAKKVMVSTFFDFKVMVYIYKLKKGSAVTVTYYLNDLSELLKDHIAKKRPELKCNCIMITHGLKSWQRATFFYNLHSKVT